MAEAEADRSRRLVNQAVTHTLAIQDNVRDPQGEAYTRAQEGLAAVHDEFRTRVLKGDAVDPYRQVIFDSRVTDGLIAVHQDRRDRRRAERLGVVLQERRTAISGDWGIINKEFPGQYEEPDYDLQSQLGDVPPRSKR